MKTVNKQDIKNLMGQVPLAAEAYWLLRQSGRPVTPEFNLDKLERLIPEWRKQVMASSYYNAQQTKPGRDHRKKVFIFGTLRYWIEHASLVGVALAGMGHLITFAYMPFARWQKPIDPFTLRRQNLYTENVLSKAGSLVKIVSLLNQGKLRRQPAELLNAVKQVSLKDTQYTLQMEEVSLDSDLYKLRCQRNFEAASATFAYLRRHKPDVVILPNGTILEFGAIYQVARYLDIPVVTYEFGEQKDRIWLAQNAEVMRQDTSHLWNRHKDQELSLVQQEQLQKLFASRQHASLFENFARRWQGVPSEGGEKVRQSLDLDQRPVVLLATNVIGDSLTLGRQVFSDSMTEWLERTVQYFASRPDVQLVARIHPGELITKGPSVADVVHKTLPNLPENIHLVPADAKINTYDIVEIADLGLVYTTTVGMEMAMSGVPVIVVGNTHYRDKGFTVDPKSWTGYFELLTMVLANPVQYRISQKQVAQAWNYAYRFFFEYPRPFPWHLLHIWKDLETWPLSRLLSEEGLFAYRETFDNLVGEPIQW